MFEVSPASVFLFALLTAVATGLGVAPFCFIKQMSRKWLAISNAVAAGLMLTASFGLVYEGLKYSTGKVTIGIVVGLLFIVWSQEKLKNKQDLRMGNLKALDARKAILLLGVMTLHSFTEGVGVGVSFGGGEKLGLFITTAIALHNIPEGLAIALVLIPRGCKLWTAALWCIFSSIPQPFMALPAYFFVGLFAPFLPIGLGFAAGAMIWMVFCEMLPESIEESSPNTVAVTVTISVAIMILIQETIR
ncbi:MAG: ZIP family metal transporter [Planctomycetota bacterium]|nr:ZIP family metal transporter [Planctomycetota bacterium]MDA1138315.1 ZIP family metal transporter [Planctomycetota bacterium]